MIQYADYIVQGETGYLVSFSFVYDDGPDPYSNYRAEIEIRTRTRCERIEVRTGSNLVVLGCFRGGSIDQRSADPAR